MKRIEAIIREQYLEAVRNRLNEIGVEEFTVTGVQSFGKEKTREVYRGVAYEISSRPRFLIMILAFDHAVNEILEAIVEGARNAGDRDGTILVTTVDEVVHIRNAEVRRVAC
jgi:nitrogen regulatory protein P-II 1